MRGLLDIQKGEWEDRTMSNKCVISDILLTHKRLEKMTAADNNMQKAQVQQKHWYDRTIRQWTVEPGEGAGPTIKIVVKALDPVATDHTRRSNK